MNFNSYLFVFVFYPVALAGFYWLKKRGEAGASSTARRAGAHAVPLSARRAADGAGCPSAALKWWLILLSLFFCGFGHLDSLAVFAASMAGNYALLRLIFRAKESAAQSGRVLRNDAGQTGGNPRGSAAQSGGASRNRTVSGAGRGRPVRGLVTLGVLFNLAMLGFFKYFNFLAGTVLALFGEGFTAQSIVLPLGISFFTFQQISLLVDAGRGEVGACSPTDYLVYITFFPKLLMGPITTYQEMKPQFDAMAARPWESGRFLRGGALFVLGMAKKCILAQNLEPAANFVFTNITSLSFLEGLLGMLCYLAELYFDFSGYCDMGCGLCQMMGLDLPVNFRSPLQSIHIVDYWQRWHITLSRFFTKYVYIPLGGNRRGTARMCANIFLIFLLSGLWHGAAWTYVVWGALQGALYVPVKLASNARRKAAARRGESVRPLPGPVALAARLWNFVVIAATLVFFRSATVGDALRYFQTMGESLLGGTALRLGTAFLKTFQADELWYVFKGLGLGGWAASPYLCMAVLLGVSFYFALFSPNAAQLAKRQRFTVRGALVYAVLFAWCVMTYASVSTFVYVNF